MTDKTLIIVSTTGGASLSVLPFGVAGLIAGSVLAIICLVFMLYGK